MVVQRNQAQRYQDLVWYCDTPPLPCDRPWRTHRAVSKGHGRLAERRLNCRDDLDDERTWPGVQQVLQRTCDRTELKTGAVTYATSYALTSVPAAVAPAADVARWWRKHWAIEHQVHDVRDVTLGEDAHQMDTGQAPQVLAALRNALLNRLREAGWTNIAAAVRHYSWSVTNALQFLGVGAS